jgi:Protein of unknown function (DUF559)
MGVYVLDFYCDGAKLAVEVDGAHHTMGGHPAGDLERDAWFAARGIETLRIPAIEVLSDPSGLLALILATVRERLAGASGHRPARSRWLNVRQKRTPSYPLHRCAVPLPLRVRIRKPRP